MGRVVKKLRKRGADIASRHGPVQNGQVLRTSGKTAFVFVAATTVFAGALVSSGTATAAPNPVPALGGPKAAIVGGVTETIDRPFVAALILKKTYWTDHHRSAPASPKDRFFCTATLTAGGGNKKVITAGHCLAAMDGDIESVTMKDRTDFAKYVTVFIGRRVLTVESGDVREVADVRAHPSYHDGVYDAAVITLKTASTQTGIPLATKAQTTQWTEGKSFQVWGFGLTNESGDVSNTLRKASQKVSDRLNGNPAFLADWKTGGGCFGDSGGPATVGTSPDYVQIGLVTGGTTCNHGIYIYAALGAYPTGTTSPLYSWVRNKVDDCTCH
jgi:hypothetical protein